MIRAAIYARFSSDNQTEASIEAQLQICNEYCRRKSYTVVKTYTDEAKSGTTIAKRDNYKKMLSDIKNDVYDVIVFHKIDRNARNEYDYYQFKNKILSLGKSYEYAGQNVDNSPEGQLMENNLVGFAAYFSRNLSKEVKKGQLVKAGRAMFLGGKPPLGYKIIDRKYVIDESEAGAVRIIFDMYNRGYGYGDIIKTLNENGYKTKRSNAFGKNSLHDILCNERYKGVYFFGKRPKINGKANSHQYQETALKVSGALPQIVSSDIFDEVQAKMQKRKFSPGAFSAKVPYLLTGLVYDEYGNKMCGHTYGVRGKYRYNYYRYANSKLQSSDIKIKKDYLEQAVISMLSKKLTPACVSQIILKAAKILAADAPNQEHELKSLTSKKKEAEKRLDNFYSFIEKSGDSFDLQRLQTIKSEITDLETTISKLSRPKALIPLPDVEREWLQLIGDIKKEASPVALKALLTRLVKRVVVKKKDVSLVVNPFHAFGMFPLGATNFTNALRTLRFFLGFFFCIFFPRTKGLSLKKISRSYSFRPIFFLFPCFIMEVNNLPPGAQDELIIY